ncbi:hypothetical protein ACA910_003681 [Epithemia clementina (nom. ined.)]
MEWYEIVVAGSLAGAIGIGVAYPFDTIKTKQVILNRQLAAQPHSQPQRQPQQQPEAPSATEAQQALATMHKLLVRNPLPSTPLLLLLPLSCVSPRMVPSSFSSSFSSLTTTTMTTSTTAASWATATSAAAAVNVPIYSPRLATALQALAVTAAISSSGEVAAAKRRTMVPYYSLEFHNQNKYSKINQNKNRSVHKTKTQSSSSQQMKNHSSPTSLYSITDVIRHIWQTEGSGGGLAGFWAGAQTMMIGQALIKGLAFWVNAQALQWFLMLLMLLPSLPEEQPSPGTSLWLLGHVAPHLSETHLLFLAAATAGFLSSFITAPLERIGCIMQAQQQPSQPPPQDNDWPHHHHHSEEEDRFYESEWHCVQHILETQGWFGWLWHRGSWTVSVLRDMPADMIYFALYGWAMSTPCAQQFLAAQDGWPVVPFVLGGLVGMASWIPVYPIDVVKTLYQAQLKPPNTNNSKDNHKNDKNNNIRRMQSPPPPPPRVVQSPWQIAQELWRQGDGGNGASTTSRPAAAAPWSAFYQGLDSKLIRAAVQHSVTFGVFDTVLRAFQQQ